MGLGPQTSEQGLSSATAGAVRGGNTSKQVLSVLGNC